VRGSAVSIAVLVGLVVTVPVIIVAVLGAGASAPAGAAPGGVGRGLRTGTVPSQYAALVLQAGSMCPAAPPSVIAAQIEQESGWDPHSVSSAGAQGISQFMPGTWPGWSLPGQSPFDPAAAIPAQGRYDCAIAAELEPGQKAGRYGGTGLTSLMLAGYNAGPGAVTAAGGIPNNGETPAYVARITAGAAHYAETTGVVAAGPFGAKVIAAAQSQLGRPYVWGGGDDTGPTAGGFDCSGLVLFAVYQASGGAIKLPHDADAQTRGGTAVDRAAMAPGDLISFTSAGASIAHHVGIYLGNEAMLDAPETGDVVHVTSLAGGYWQAEQWRVARYG